MNAVPTFGRRLAALPSLQERVELEQAEGRRQEFALLDRKRNSGYSY